MPEVRNPLWNFEAFNFRSRIWFERKPLARNLKGVFPRNIQFYACIIQLSLCIQPDLCNIEVRLVQYTYMFNGTCSKCAQLIEILRSASETQRKRSFRRKGSLGITSLPFEMILHQHAFVRICWACIILLSLLSIDISMDLPIPTYLLTSTYIYSPSTDISLHLPTPAYIYLHLPTSTYIYRHLPTSTYIYLHLPTSTYIYRHLPTSTYIYLHLPTSTDIYRHLPTSTYIYLHLPTSTYLPIGGIVSQWFVSWVGGWHCETSNLHIYGIPGVGSERWNLFAWAALNGDAPLEVLVVTMDCPTKTCPSQLSVQIISAPACDSTNLSPSNLRSIAQLSISSFCSFSICSSSWGWSFGSGQLASVSCRDCGKKQLGAPKIPSPDGNSRCWGNMALLVLITEAAIQRYTMSEAIDTISSSTQ